MIVASRRDLKLCNAIKGLERKGYSSVGRAAVSKTAGPGFESWCPCHLIRKLLRLSGN